MKQSIAPPEPYRVYVVYRDSMLSWTVTKILQQAGYESCSFADGRSALDKAHSLPPSLILSELHLRFMSGLEFGDMIQAAMPRVPFLLFFDLTEHTMPERHRNRVRLRPEGPNKLLELVARELKANRPHKTAAPRLMAREPSTFLRVAE